MISAIEGSSLKMIIHDRKLDGKEFRVSLSPSGLVEAKSKFRLILEKYRLEEYFEGIVTFVRRPGLAYLDDRTFSEIWLASERHAILSGNFSLIDLWWVLAQENAK